MAKKSVPINVIIHYPKTESGKRELSHRVSTVHANTVNQYIKNLNCPSAQKVQLLDAVIQSTANTQMKPTAHSPVIKRCR